MTLFLALYLRKFVLTDKRLSNIRRRYSRYERVKQAL